MKCVQHNDREAVKNCKLCNAPLCEECAGNDLTCNKCKQAEINKRKKKATIALIFGIVTFFLFIEMVLLTIFKSLFGGYSVAFLVVGIILSIIFLTVGIILIVFSSTILLRDKIIKKQQKN